MNMNINQQEPRTPVPPGVKHQVTYLPVRPTNVSEPEKPDNVYRTDPMVIYWSVVDSIAPRANSTPPGE